ncbi:cadherin domain-containing protein, partial [Dapis sp. BLCC M172]|uniref:calcium-binding protein n=1 Tax=Dapis sp. BLCC M172 TaxID=2975281 RepID=UPI003CFB060A
DGDLDAFVGEWRGDIFYFKNTGSVGSPSFDAAKTNPFNLTNVGDESKPTFADLDNDGDLDAFVGEWRGDIFYFENQPVTPNTPPTITSSDNPSVAENTTDAITVQATDPDGDNITYSISGGEDQALFGIDSLTGAVTFKVAPDFENPTDNSGDNNYQIEVTANDGTTGSTSQAITITVTDENETPTINSSNSANVAENTTNAITVQATDADGDNITYSISGGEDQALFGIDTDTGLVTFKVAPDFENPTDNGGDNNYQIEVTANDGNADSTPEAITITVTDENETPTINSSNSANVAENTTNAITVQATDADGDNITYSISGGEDQALFGIDTDTGLVTFKVAPDFENPTDNGGDNNYQIEVTANDGTADSTSQAITITVTDENETPTMEGTTGSDRFRGTNNAENYSALDGHDRVYGYGGADNLDGGDGNDIVYGGNDDDILSGGVGHDRLNGDNGNDLLLGNDGNDILNGGAGDDTLNGGAGSDRYVGGAGADTFIIGLGLGVDLIQRFEDSTDIIELEGIDFADLDIVKSGSSTLIKVAATGEALASLSGIDVGLVGADDFSQSVI